MKTLTTRLSILVALSAALYGCGGGSGQVSNDPFGKNIVVQWNDETLTSLSRTRPGPPAGARALAIVHTAVYDAWSAYDERANGTMLGDSLRQPVAGRTFENKQKAISFAAYRALTNLFPTETARFRAKMTALGYDPDDTSEVLNTPQGVGNRAARAVIEYRANDGANQSNNYADTTGYIPVNTPDTVTDPSKWQQLRFANGASPSYLGAHWHTVAPFAISSPSMFRATPPAFGSPTYNSQVAELVNITSNLNDKEKAIAEYWADGPNTVLPPGHWNVLAHYVSDRDRHSIDEDVKMYFILGNTLLDASISCWDMKRTWNTSRPITAIRALYSGINLVSFVPGTGFATLPGSQWAPYQSGNFITPPFPEYTSGHSTFSAASAEVLKRFTGSDDFGMSVTIPAESLAFDTSAPASPVTLAWPTFSAAAQEAGMSRLYGGIHFRAADKDGQRCGREVGAFVYDFCMEYINGTRVAPASR